MSIGFEIAEALAAYAKHTPEAVLPQVESTFIGLGLNEHGTPMSFHWCVGCGAVFSVTAAVPPQRAGEWTGCMDEACTTYDPARDATRFFGPDPVLPEGARIVREDEDRTDEERGR